MEGCDDSVKTNENCRDTITIKRRTKYAKCTKDCYLKEDYAFMEKQFKQARLEVRKSRAECLNLKLKGKTNNQQIDNEPIRSQFDDDPAMEIFDRMEDEKLY